MAIPVLKRYNTFEDLIGAFAGPFEKAMLERIGEEQGYQKEERGFKRLEPLRRRVKAEDVESEFGPEAAGQYRAGNFPGKAPYKAARTAELLEKEETGLADLARSLGFPMETVTTGAVQAGPSAMADVLREPVQGPPVRKPISRLPKAAIPLLSAAAKADKIGIPNTPYEGALHQAQRELREPLGSQPSIRAVERARELMEATQVPEPKNPFQVARDIALKSGATPEMALQAGIKAQAQSAGAQTLSREQVKAQKELDDLEAAMQTIETLNVMARRLITARNPLEAAQQGATLGIGATLGWHAEASSYQRQRGAFLETVGRQLGGARGVMTEGDISRLLDLIPTFWDLAETRELNLGILNNAMEAGIRSKQRFINGETSLNAARKEVRERVSKLFEEKTAKRTGRSRPSGLGPEWGER